MPSGSLTKSQRAAVQTLSGPLLVLAGAGTGKTRVITYRIASLIKHGIQPPRILAVTFTNKAAREMKERTLQLLGKRRKRQQVPEISTFHSLCVRVLRRHISALGYPREFAIYDRGDQESVARGALRDIHVGQDRLRPGDLLAMIGSWKSRSLKPSAAEELAASDRELLGALAYARYQASLKASGAVDFDDLLLLTEELLENHAEVRFAEASRFDHLLIDEYQDTNGLQYRIVKMLAGRHRNLCVVGDDDQSIYGWRGAEVAHILNFSADWPDAKVVKLEENYRSRQSILDLANTLIAHNSMRHDKVLRAARTGGAPPRFLRFDDETQEAEMIVREIRQRLDANGEERTAPSDVAILFRTNEQPRAFELELRRARVPYVLIGGQSFYDRKEVRDILAYLRVLANPSDEVSLLRIINTPSRGIGTSSVQTLLEGAVAAGRSLWNVLPEVTHDGRVPPPVAERVERFRKMMESVRARLGSEPLSGLVGELVRTVDYRSELERIYKTASEVEARWNSVQEVINTAAQYEAREPSASLTGFLEDCTLAGRDDSRDDDRERAVQAVTLMTLHSAKGLEFRHVYMAGMEEGLMPHQRSVADGGGAQIAEERRLCYVGVTRARDSLTFSLCKARMKWGKLRPSIPSRFLMEMRGETERARRAADAASELFSRAPEPAPAKKTKRSGAQKQRAAGRGASKALGERSRRRSPRTTR